MIPITAVPVRKSGELDCADLVSKIVLAMVLASFSIRFLGDLSPVLPDGSVTT